MQQLGTAGTCKVQWLGSASYRSSCPCKAALTCSFSSSSQSLQGVLQLLLMVLLLLLLSVLLLWGVGCKA
jgi:hypothetical protein